MFCRKKGQIILSTCIYLNSDDESDSDYNSKQDSDPDYNPKQKKNSPSQSKIKEEKIGDLNEEKVKNKGGRPKKERPEVGIEGFRLFPYMKVLENKRFECQICKCSCETRHNLFTHINR